MNRIKLNLTDHFQFYVDIPIRITDLNYGGHVGNDVFLSLTGHVAEEKKEEVAEKKRGRK